MPRGLSRMLANRRNGLSWCDVVPRDPVVAIGDRVKTLGNDLLASRKSEAATHGEQLSQNTPREISPRFQPRKTIASAPAKTSLCEAALARSCLPCSDRGDAEITGLQAPDLAPFCYASPKPKLLGRGRHLRYLDSGGALNTRLTLADEITAARFTSGARGAQ